MKFRNNLFLLAMLVIIPAVSWLFLRTGVDYRLESLEDLKMEIPVSMIFLNNDSVVLKDHITFVSRNGDGKLVKQLYDQFKDAPGFQLISNEAIPEIGKTQGNYLIDESMDFAELDNKKEVGSANYYLIDGNENLRKTYQGVSESKTIVRHIATILPYVEKKQKKDDK